MEMAKKQVETYFWLVQKTLKINGFFSTIIDISRIQAVIKLDFTNILMMIIGQLNIPQFTIILKGYIL
jgi:hypothetical protein